MSLAMLSPALNAQALALEMKWREEDLKYREVEDERRAQDDARRAVDEKAEQLKAIGGISALIAGFAVVVLTNVNFPPDLDPTLLCLVSFVTAAVVGAMLIAMLSSTFLLVAVYRYDCMSRKSRVFSEWWKLMCKQDWEICFRSFVLGVPLFLVLMALIGWVIFWDYDTRTPTSSIVSVISFVTLLFFTMYLMPKWNDYLRKH